MRWHFDFIGLSRWFFSISGVILLIGAMAFATKQLNLGLDFESGSRVTVGLERDASVEDVRSTLEGVGIDNAEITEASSEQLGPNVVQIDSEIEPEQVQEIQPALDSEFGIVPNGFQSTTVGPTFGEQVARSAIYAIVFSLLVICAYVAFRFEPKYAVPVIIAVIHDILITGGVYSLTGREVTSGTVAAFLTILGYSLYDTVIVFDRIRENVPRLPRATFSQVVNRSMSEVLTRSLITGLSSVFLVGVLMIFGGETLRDFAFAMLVGIASGTYSSIFIASPVLTHWKEREPAYRRRRERIEEQMGHVPAFPEENVIARVEGGPEAGGPPEAPPPPAPEREPEPVPPAPAPSRSSVPGVLPEPPTPARPPAPAEEPQPPPVPAGDGEPAADGDAGGAGDREGDGARKEAPTAPSSARRAPPPCGGCASRNRASAGAGGAAASTGGTADGGARLVHDGGGALALHRLRPRPLPRRDRRRLHRRHRGRDGQRRDRPDRARRQHRRDRLRHRLVRGPGHPARPRSVYLSACGRGSSRSTCRRSGGCASPSGRSGAPMARRAALVPSGGEPSVAGWPRPPLPRSFHADPYDYGRRADRLRTGAGGAGRGDPRPPGLPHRRAGARVPRGRGGP